VTGCAEGEGPAQVVAQTSENPPGEDPSRDVARRTEPYKFTEPDAFYDLLRLTKFNYRPLSTEELAAASEVIATGKIVAVRPGKKLIKRVAPNDRYLVTLVVELEVASTSKGAAADRLYVEFLDGGAFSAETYNQNLPADPVTVYLKRSNRQETEDIYHIDVGAGHPEGVTLYALTNPQGLLVERDGQMVSPWSETFHLKVREDSPTPVDAGTHH
jgi:hypothetical protein